MMKAIAIDDEPLALKVITHLCEQVDFVSLEKTFTSQAEAIKYLNKYPVDLLFLDIQMPAKNGIEFYKMLENGPMVIFTTAYSEYAVEGFNVNATDYLLKPFSPDRFIQALEKARNEWNFRKNQTTQSHLMIRADYKLHRIPYEDILYIEGLDDYIQIYQVNKPKIVARFSMKNILEQLPGNLFIRVHRSFIVPLKRVDSVQYKSLKIGEVTIPIGETYKEEIQKYF